MSRFRVEIDGAFLFLMLVVVVLLLPSLTHSLFFSSPVVPLLLLRLLHRGGRAVLDLDGEVAAAAAAAALAFAVAALLCAVWLDDALSRRSLAPILRMHGQREEGRMRR